MVNLPLIGINDIKYIDAKKCATQICRQCVEHRTWQNKTKRAVVQRCKSFKSSFTPGQVEQIISKLKP